MTKSSAASAADYTWVQRLSLAAGGLAAVTFAPSEAQAAIQYVPAGLPVVNSAKPITQSWDVDGDGQGNFELFVAAGANRILFQALNYAGTFNEVVGFAANPTTIGPQRLASNAVVGPAAGNWVPPYANMFYGANNADPNRINTVITNFQDGLNYFGFRFQKNGDTFYGWAEMNVNLNASPTSVDVTVTRWAYNTTPNASIQVAEVPGPLGLAGLAVGAAWTRKLRRRLREAP